MRTPVSVHAINIAHAAMPQPNSAYWFKRQTRRKCDQCGAPLLMFAQMAKRAGKLEDVGNWYACGQCGHRPFGLNYD